MLTNKKIPCNRCKSIADYFQNEADYIQLNKEELIQKLGIEVFSGMEASIQAYKKVIDKTVEAF